MLLKICYSIKTARDPLRVSIYVQYTALLYRYQRNLRTKLAPHDLFSQRQIRANIQFSTSLTTRTKPGDNLLLMQILQQWRLPLTPGAHRPNSWIWSTSTFLKNMSNVNTKFLYWTILLLTQVIKTKVSFIPNLLMMSKKTQRVQLDANVRGRRPTLDDVYTASSALHQFNIKRMQQHGARESLLRPGFVAVKWNRIKLMQLLICYTSDTIDN